MAARAGFAFADSFTLPPSRFRRFLPKRMGVITTTTTRKRKKVATHQTVHHLGFNLSTSNLRMKTIVDQWLGIILIQRKKVFNQPDIKINQNGLPKRFSEDS